MAYNVSERDLSGGVLPNIYITNIDLSAGAMPSRSKNENPHTSAGSNSTRGSVSPTNQSASGMPVKSASLKVNLSMHFKAKGLNAALNTGLTKHLKVLLIQCTSETLHDRLTSDISNFMSSYIDTGSMRDVEGKHFSYRIISASNIKSNLSKKSTTSGKNGSSLSNISLDQSFTLNTHQGTPDVTFLSYFAIPFLDRNEMQYNHDGSSEFGRNDRRILSMSSFGNVSSEIVLKGGRTNKKSFAFKSTSMNEFWIGPKHQMDDGSYMKYSSHGGNPKNNLLMIEVDNIKVKDHRVYDKICGLDINLFDEESSIIEDEKIISEARKDRSLSMINKKNHDFISEFMITRDTFNNARFMFSIDVEGMIRSATDFPMFLSNVKSSDHNLYNTLIKNTKIRNLKISRRTIKTNQDTSLLFKKAPFVEGEESIVILETADSNKSSGYLKPIIYTTNTIQDQSGELLGVQPRPLGSLEELSIVVTSGNAPVRHFSGSDFDVSKKKSGTYEYVLELEFEDPVLPMMKTMLNKLKQLIYGTSPYGTSGLEQYHRDSISQPDAYDSITNQFNMSFINFYNKKYGGTDQSNNENFIFYAVNTFINMLYSLSGTAGFDQQYMSQEDALMYLTNMSSPNSGSPEGISKFLQLAYIFQEKIEGVIRKNSRYKKYRGGGFEEVLANNKGIQSSNERKNQKISHTFKETYNSNTNSQIGYEYLFSSSSDKENNLNGLTLFSDSIIKERFKLETQKYFKALNTDVSIVDKDNNEYNPGENIENTKYSFLSTSNIYLLESDKNIIFSNVNKRIKTPEFKKMNEVLSRVLTYNYAKDTLINMSARQDVDNSGYKLIQTLNQASVGNSRDLRRGKDRANSHSVFKEGAKKELIDDGELLFVEREGDSVISSNMVDDYKRVLMLSNFISNSDFLNENNSSKYYFLNDENGANKIKDRANYNPTGLIGAPNQIKSLFLSFLGSDKVYNNSAFEGIGNLYDISSDVFRNPEYAGFIFFNYKNLRRIEVFKGYGMTKDKLDIKNPIFKPLKKEDINNSSLSPILCRHVKYESSLFGIKNNENTELPTYNEYFLISSKEGNFLNNSAASANSFILNSFYKQYNSSMPNSARRIRKKYKQFFDKRSATTEVKSEIERDIVRQEYMNSNIVINKSTIYSEGLMDRQEANALKNKIHDIGKQSIAEMHSNIMNSPLAPLLSGGLSTMNNNSQTTSRAPTDSGDGGATTSQGSTPSTTSSGGSTY